MTTLRNPLLDAGFDVFRVQQDYFVLGGDRSPGCAVLKSASSKRSFDIRKGYGTSGATAIYTGDELATPVFEVQLWNAQTVADWLTFAKKYLSKPPRGISPSSIFGLDIQHPALNAEPLNIKSVQVLEVTALAQDEYGLFTCEVHFLEYRKPLPALGKPDASIPAVNKPQPTAQDAAEREIQQLRAQRDALAG